MKVKKVTKPDLQEKVNDELNKFQLVLFFYFFTADFFLEIAIPSKRKASSNLKKILKKKTENII
jgi:hypothetical protein